MTGRPRNKKLRCPYCCHEHPSSWRIRRELQENPDGITCQGCGNRFVPDTDSDAGADPRAIDPGRSGHPTNPFTIPSLISNDCPHCGHRTSAPLAAVNTPVVCSRCHRKFLVQQTAIDRRFNDPSGGDSSGVSTRSFTDRRGDKPDPSPPPAIPYATLPRRVFAGAIDGMILMAGSAAVWAIVWVSPAALSMQTVLVAALATTAGLGVLYFTLTESSSGGASWGKRCCGIYVVKLTGGRLTAGQALARHISKALSIATCYFGVFMALANDRRQMLHDLMVRSVVLHR